MLRAQPTPQLYSEPCSLSPAQGPILPQVALKPAVQLSKPLWSEVLDLCGGEFVDIAREGRS